MTHKIVPGTGSTKFWLVVRWKDGVKVKHPAGSEIEAKSVFNQFYREQKEFDNGRANTRTAICPAVV